MRTKEYFKAGLKSLTDPGFLFNAGNTLPVLNDLRAASITASVAALCASIRFINELDNKGVKNPLPQWTEKFVKNPGTTLQLTGIFLGTAAASALPGIEIGNPETYFTPIFSGTLGIANIALGAELNTSSDKLKRIFNTIGQVGISGALLYASQNAPIIVQALFGASGALAVAFNASNRTSLLGIITPNRANALGAISNVIAHPSTIFKAANALWACAYASLDHAQRAMKKEGPESPSP